MNISLDSATEPLARLLCFWFAFSSYILSGSRQSRIFILQGFIKVSISDLFCNLNRKQLALSFASDILHYCPHHCHHHFHQNSTHCASVTLAWAAVMLSGIFFSCCLWVICRTFTFRERAKLQWHVVLHAWLFGCIMADVAVFFFFLMVAGDDTPSREMTRTWEVTGGGWLGRYKN